MVLVELLGERRRVVEVDPRFGWGKFISLRQERQLMTIFGPEPSGRRFEDQLMMVTSEEEQMSIPARVAEFGLTPCQYAVAMHAVEGKRYTQIAEVLGISEHVVKNHVSRCLAKTKVYSSVELALKGMSVGLFPLELVRSYTPPMDFEVVRKLARRESEALGLLVQGKSYGQIAWEMGVDHSTIRNYLHNIYGRFSPRQNHLSLAVNFALDGYGFDPAS